jgi:hypothetical protein
MVLEYVSESLKKDTDGFWRSAITRKTLLIGRAEFSIHHVGVCVRMRGLIDPFSRSGDFAFDWHRAHVVQTVSCCVLELSASVHYLIIT